MIRNLRGTYLLIDLSRDGMAAAAVKAGPGRLMVQRVGTATRSNVSSAPEEVGPWLRQALREAGISTTRAIFAAPRGDVVLKVLELPTVGIQSEAEICEAVRLQMSRQLTMPIEDSIIDSVTLEAGDDARVTNVLVGAIHRERVVWYREVARHAGLKLTGVRLRSGGIARLTSGLEGPVLIIAGGMETTDYVVADRGRVLFARSVELKHAIPEVAIPLLREEGSEPEPDLAQRTAVEAKRTWMSYRVSQRAEDVRAILVMGCGSAAGDVCDRCSALLDLPARCLELPETVKVHPRVDADALGTYLPLIGLGVPTQSAGGLDFLNPRRPPDLGARRRQMVLAGILGLIVVGGAGYLYRQDRLDALNAVKAARQSQLDDLAGEYRRYLVERARAENVRRWNAMDADWIGHLSWLSERLPDPRSSLADRVNMAMTGEVKYEGRSFPGGEWTSQSRVAIDVSGKVNDRSIALTLRERLLEAGLFTVVNRGPDVADRYDYELTTNFLSPSDKVAGTPAGASPNGSKPEIDAGERKPADGEGTSGAAAGPEEARP
ncbi:MAG: hypothetical protein KJZ65_14245 [Phycisphaerales bacterium]|nr:hypothetical protein [Phycisphaerales bacterium]